MNCTPEKCPHAALMERARSLCLGCDHTEPAGHGGKVSFEAMGEYLAERTRLKFGNGATQGPLTLRLDLHDEDALRMLLATLAALNRSDAVIVWHLLNGRTQKQIAKIEGVTRQAIHVRMKGFVRRHPDLAVLCESMMRPSRDELAPAMRDGQGPDRNGGSIRRADRVGVGTPEGVPLGLCPRREVPKKNVVTFLKNYPQEEATGR